MEQRARIINDNPKLFRLIHHPTPPPHHPIALVGIECGDGWLDLLERTCRWLERIISGLTTREDLLPCATQIKEKFGELRFYMDSSTDVMREVIEGARLKSLQTCEFCGAPGELRFNKWYRTTCEPCEREKNGS